MASNIYTKQEVDNALLRAQIALYLISQKIGSNFLFMNSLLYSTYKDLQYDIYILFFSLAYNEPFNTFGSPATAFETQYYELVGALINKLKTIDFTGAFGGTLNPNAQVPGIVFNIVTSANFKSTRVPFTNQTIISITSFQANYAPIYGNFAILTIWVTQDAGASYQQDTATVPTIINLGGNINAPDSYTWTYPVPTTGYIQIDGFMML